MLKLCQLSCVLLAAVTVSVEPLVTALAEPLFTVMPSGLARPRSVAASNQSSGQIFAGRDGIHFSKLASDGKIARISPRSVLGVVSSGHATVRRASSRLLTLAESPKPALHSQKLNWWCRDQAKIPARNR